MATVQALADQVLALALACLAAHQAEFAALAREPREVLVAAQELMRERNRDQPEPKRTSEHIAFAVLALAFRTAAAAD